MDSQPQCIFHKDRIAISLCFNCNRPICLQDQRVFNERDISYNKRDKTELVYNRNVCLFCKQAFLENENRFYFYDKLKMNMLNPERKKIGKELISLREETKNILKNIVFTKSSNYCIFHPDTLAITTCKSCHLPICQQEKRVIKLFETKMTVYGKTKINYDIDLNSDYCLFCKKMILLGNYYYLETYEHFNKKTFHIRDDILNDLQYLNADFSSFFQRLPAVQTTQPFEENQTDNSELVNNEINSNKDNTDESNSVACRYNGHSIAYQNCEKCNQPICNEHLRVYTSFSSYLSEGTGNYFSSSSNHNWCLDCYAKQLQKDAKYRPWKSTPRFILGFLSILLSILLILSIANSINYVLYGIVGLIFAFFVLLTPIKETKELREKAQEAILELNKAITTV